jgi:hypothetical protein
VFLYGASLADVVNTGDELVAGVAPGNFLVLDGIDHELTHVVISPETAHTVDGELGEFEVRYVHVAPDGTVAVIGQVAVLGDAPAQIIDDLLRERPTPGQITELRPLDLYGAAGVGTEVGHDIADAEACGGAVRRGLMTTPLVVSADQAAALDEIF